MDARSILLGFLMNRSMTGYELKKAFSISFSFFSGLSYGSIYPALGKMEKEGLIRMQAEMRKSGPNRKICTITAEGRKVFLETLKEPFAFEGTKSIFLTRLFFFAHLAPEERRSSAHRYFESVRQVEKTLQRARPEIEAKADRFQLLCYRFGLRFFEDLSRNIAQTVKALEKE
ncbi:MAG: PadR family transcriptional regulator [Deltaproteobacteria bacterium]|nr:PadR family transcriptional regulator [Deltaproteobacteria bacterium]